MAETTLFVSGQCGATIKEGCPEAMERGEARPPVTGNGLRLVGSGRPSEALDLRIVDPETASPLHEGRVGEIWFRGTQVTRSYRESPDATAATFGGRLADGTGPFVRSGHLGFLHDGQLFVSGRGAA